MTADEFIAKWQVSGGNERANTQLFVSDLCTLLGVAAPQPTMSDSFIPEAKQGSPAAQAEGYAKNRRWAGCASWRMAATRREVAVSPWR